MDIEQLSAILNECENKELPVTITGNNSFGVDITNVEMIENEKILLLYENAYYKKTGKCFLSPVKTVKDLSGILDTIGDKSMKIKGRGTNMVLVSPTDCRFSWSDDYVTLDLYDKSEPITTDKAKKDAQIFIDTLHTG